MADVVYRNESVLDHGYSGSHEPGEKRVSRLPLVSFFFWGMENDLNYYPFHIGDYLSATRHLSWEEDAAYRRLLDTYYTTEKPLPLDLRAVCRLVLAHTDSQRQAVETVLQEFFQKTDEGWTNSRADAEIDAMRAKQQKQRERANKRWHKPEQERGNATAQEIDAVASKSYADAMPPTPTPTPIKDTPIPPTQASGAMSPKTAAVSLPTWLVTIKAMGEQPIPETDPVFDYAEQAGIPMEMLRLCWVEFRSRYSEPNAKRYKDWRGVYRKAVRGNWLRLWRTTPEGGYVLTTEGQQAQRVLDAKQAVAA